MATIIDLQNNLPWLQTRCEIRNNDCFLQTNFEIDFDMICNNVSIKWMFADYEIIGEGGRSPQTPPPPCDWPEYVWFRM